MLKSILLNEDYILKIQFKEKKQLRLVCEEPIESIDNETVTMSEGELTRYAVQDFIEQKSKYQIGDRVFLQEGFVKAGWGGRGIKYENNSDLALPWEDPEKMSENEARTFLKITNVRLQRLQDITEEDAKLEGIDVRVIPHNPPTYIYMDYSVDKNNRAFSPFRLGSPIASFMTFWDRDNKGECSWDSNPCVFVYDYEVEDPLPRQV